MPVNVDSLNGFKETLINTRETIERETKEFLQLVMMNLLELVGLSLLL
jgi:hypothetical protein